MGFFDNTKDRLRNIAKGVGEETIRVVDYDEIVEQKPVPTPKQAKPAKVKPEPKVKLERKPLNVKFPKFADKAPKQEKPVKIEEPEPVVEPEKPEVFEVPEDYSDSAFAIQQPSAFSKPTQLTGIDMNPVDTPEARAGRVQDVLDLLKIPSTFEIERDVFLPEDLRDISFDTQVPQGYDMGQVNTFVGQTKMSIGVLTSLLKLRNEHIAQLATTVDRMQVDANNLKYEKEIAVGINIMPTEDDEYLQNKNNELKIRVQQLNTILEQYKQNGHNPEGGLSESEHKKYDALQDEVSLLRRESETVNEQLVELKNQNAILIEENDSLTERLEELETSESDSADANDSDGAFTPLDEGDDTDDSLPSLPGLDETADSESLPSFDFDGLDVDTNTDDSNAFKYNADDYSAWDNKADDFGQHGGYNENTIYSDGNETLNTGLQINYAVEGDEEDEIDRLQKEWGNN